MLAHLMSWEWKSGGSRFELGASFLYHILNVLLMRKAVHDAAMAATWFYIYTTAEVITYYDGVYLAQGP